MKSEGYIQECILDHMKSVLLFFSPPKLIIFSTLNDWNSLSKNKKNKTKTFYASSYNSPDFASGLGGHLDMLE